MYSISKALCYTDAEQEMPIQHIYRTTTVIGKGAMP